MLFSPRRVLLNRNGSSKILSNYKKFRQISNNVSRFKNLEQIVTERKSQASRSIVVQVASEKSFDNVYQHCSQFGNISNAFFYAGPKSQNHILLEFETSDSVNEALQSSRFPPDGGIPVKSQFLWLRNTPNTSKLQQIEPTIELNVSDKTDQPSNDNLVNILRKADSISHQMKLFHENTRLNELSTRLRYLGVQQIELALSGIFLNPVVWPFGSTVSGFGKLRSDLDMILQYNNTNKLCEWNLTNKRLMFHVKSFGSNHGADSHYQRELIQGHIRVIGSICENFLTGINDVKKIYTARVPIIRYSHEYLNISADISLLNMSGFYVSELFYIFGQIDNRVQPLLFAAQRWIKKIQANQKRPPALTNFHVTCLVISFLQQIPKPILPTVKQLIAQARPEDTRHTIDDENYSFLRDLSQLEFKTKNSDSLEELFMQFLEYYGTFDFKKNLINLYSTGTYPKLAESGLQIMNPFVVEQNWGRNVTSDDCAEIKTEAQYTLGDLLDEFENGKGKRWGLLTIFNDLK